MIFTLSEPNNKGHYKLKMFDTIKGKLLFTIEAEEDDIDYALFSPDSKYLLTAEPKTEEKIVDGKKTVKSSVWLYLRNAKTSKQVKTIDLGIVEMAGKQIKFLPPGNIIQVSGTERTWSIPKLEPVRETK